jgi:hypothetical protein
VEDVAEEINVKDVRDCSPVVGFKGIVALVLQFVFSAKSVEGQKELIETKRIIRHFI